MVYAQTCRHFLLISGLIECLQQTLSQCAVTTGCFSEKLEEFALALACLFVSIDAC